MSRRLIFSLQLGSVAAVALVLRLVAVMAWTRHLTPEGDQNFYWRQAQWLADGHGFVYRNNFGEWIPTAVHPPLHSAYLALVGLLPFDEQSHLPYRLACAVLGTVTVVVIGLAARKVAGDRAAVLAAGFAAVYPNLWLNDVMFLSESMFALTVALVLLAAACFAQQRTDRNAAILGVTIALAALTRVEAQLLFVLLVLPLMAMARDETWKLRIRRVLITGGVGVIVLAPWVVRNFVSFEKHPPTISTSTGFVLEVGNCDATYGLAPPADKNGVPLEGHTDPTEMLGYWWPLCDDRAWPGGDETVVGAYKQERALQYMNEHKGRLPLVVAARVGRMWDVWRPGQSYEFNTFYERRGDYPTRAAMAMYYPLLVAALAGLWVLWRRRITIVPYVAVFAATTFTAAVSFGITRYRVGAEVVLPILAAVAVDALVRRWRREPDPAVTMDDGTASGPAGRQSDDPVLVGTTSGDTS